MGTENRDWYRDWWRKKTGYTERADFRVSESQYRAKRRRSDWRKFWLRAAKITFLLYALALMPKVVAFLQHMYH